MTSKETELEILHSGEKLGTLLFCSQIVVFITRAQHDFNQSNLK